MSDGVEFDEEKRTYVRPPGAPTSFSGGNVFNEQPYIPNGDEPRMVQWLINHGYVKNPARGNIVLLTVVGLNIIIIFFVVKNFL